MRLAGKKTISIILTLMLVIGTVAIGIGTLNVRAVTEDIPDIYTGWYWPLDSKYTHISSDFGYRKYKDNDGKWHEGYHQGIDICKSGISGQTVYAARKGKVAEVGWLGTGGNYVSIRHGSYNGNVIYTTYMHLKNPGGCVSVGQDVDQSTVIGYVGGTGGNYTHHLHFQICKNNRNPNHDTSAQLSANYFNPSPNNISYSYDHSSSAPISAPGPVLDLSCDKSIYKTSESIVFTWSPVVNATEYWVYLWKDGEQLYAYNCGNVTSFTQAPSNEGNYTLYIRPGNSAGYNDSSNSCSFIVSNSKPGPVTDLHSEKTVYNTSEPIHFTWSPVANATVYWVYLWKDGEQLYSYNCGNVTSFTQAPSSEGNYTLIIRPGNDNGFNDGSVSCSFIVSDSKPDPVTYFYSDKPVYNTSEFIYFTWSPVVNATEYWVYLWKDGEQLYAHNCGNVTSFTQAPSTEGNYTLIIRPGNSNGFNDGSVSCQFTVSDSLPDSVTDLHSDKDKYNTSESINFSWSPVANASEYWVYLWKDGTELFGYNCGNNFSFTQLPSTEGNYTLIIRPANSNGFNNSSISCSFVVADDRTLTYNANGGKNPPASQTGNGSITLSSAKPSRSGYIFLGWATSSSAAVAQYQPGDTYNLTKDTILYAVWKADGGTTPTTYTLTYNANGGKNPPAKQTTTNGSLTLSSAKPTRSGYTFLGWATTSNAKEAQFKSGTAVTIKADVTLYAVWKVNSTANAKINVAGATTLSYRTIVTIKATATNLDSGYYLVLVVDGKEIKGDNKEVVYEHGELTSDLNYYVKIVDNKGIVQKDANGNSLKKEGGTITCNAGFFQKLIAFFQGLFGALPKKTVQP